MINGPQAVAGKETEKGPETPETAEAGEGEQPAAPRKRGRPRKTPAAAEQAATEDRKEEKKPEEEETSQAMQVAEESREGSEEAALDSETAESADTEAGKETDKSKQSAAAVSEDTPKEAQEVKHVKRVYQPSEDRPEVEGILEIADGGFGFLRFHNFLTSDQDVYVSPSQIRRFNLKTGDKIKGISRKPNEGEKFGAILYVKEVNGDEPGVAMRRPDFDELTPIFPNERIFGERIHRAVHAAYRFSGPHRKRPEGINCCPLKPVKPCC